MLTITHKITHYYQPTNNSCSQAALAMLLSFFDKKLSPAEIMNEIPVYKDDKGNDWGSINQQLATWCISQGFTVEMYTTDFQIIDLSWSNLNKENLLKRMIAAKNIRNISSLGKKWSEIYMQSYIDFIEAGGKLHIIPYMTTKLLDTLLSESPLFTCVNTHVLYNFGRFTDHKLRELKSDDLHGKLANHTIVIYGKDSSGSYLVADPWKKPGMYPIEPEHLLCAMTASQMECDNLIFQLK